MPKSTNQKLKLFYIHKMLWEETDETHFLTVNDIIKRLEIYGIKAERKSVYDDIETLEQFGVDIICLRSKANKYFIGQRDFELPELKLLVDAVLASRFITTKKSMKLIGELEKLTSIHQAKALRRQVQMQNRIKNMHETIYLTVDTLHEAINRKKKVSFQYWDWTINKSEKLRRNGDRYEESPCALCWDNEFYYLVTFNAKHKDFVHYRVDKMANVIILGEPCDFSGMIEEFDISKYANRYFGMHSGEEENVTLRMNNEMIGVVIDRFGKDLIIQKINDKQFEITVKVAVSPVFLAWVMGFDTSIKVMSPQSVCKQIRDRAIKIAELYK